MQHEQDPYLWLEEISSERALDWVQQENARTEQRVHDDEFERVREQLLNVLNSEDKIPGPNQRGEFIYNFWQDATNPRGLWRRTTVASYATDSPQWEVLLDVDTLSAEENVEWVFAGTSTLRPSDQHVMVSLSPDGGDATQLREYDLATKAFRTPEQGGFFIETAKTWFDWEDENTLLIATPTSETDTTASSYPAKVRRLERGSTLEDAPVIFEVDLNHLGTSAEREVDPDPRFKRLFATDVIDFFNAQEFVHDGENFVPVPVPTSMRISFHRDWLVLYPREEYQYSTSASVPGGSLLVADAAGFMAGTATAVPVYVPDERSALTSWSFLDNLLLLNVLRDVRSTMEAVELPEPSGGVQDDEQPAQPRPVQVDTSALTGTDPYQMFSFGKVDRFGTNPNQLWLTTTGFLTPTTLYRADVEFVSGANTATLVLEKVKTAPGFFEATNYRVAQYFAASADGTEIPYFVLHHKDMASDGANPTLLSGYGGFQLARTPAYDPMTVLGWCENTDAIGRHGVYVLANIRGGGEYGPRWHQAALQEKRHRAYEDFAAVAQDVMSRKITSPQHLAAAGGSNGGLLIGNMMMSYPHLFGALSCGVPLLDMKRYTKLSAGHSWIAEYGDPDIPEQWEFIKTFSPYHLADELVADQAELAKLPATLFWTASTDDRVGPVQARKMAAKLMEAGAQQVWFHEVLDGGHSGAADFDARARLTSRYQRFLWTHVAEGAQN